MFKFFFNRNEFSFKDIGLKCDVHSHILPGVDDGAGDIAASSAILQKMVDAGVERAILTPHVSSGLFPNKAPFLKLELERLKASLDPEISSKISLHLASEYMIDEDFETIEDLLTFRGKRILVEMSYSQRSINLQETIFRLVEDGYEPVLAHPERYVFYFGRKQPSNLEEIEKLRDMGCLFQLNVMSLTGAYGPASLDNIKYFLDHDFYSYIGTDIHSVTQIDHFEHFKVSASQFEKVRALALANEELF